MAEEKATAKKAASAEPAAEVTAAETETAPVQGGGDVPVNELVDASEESASAVSEDDKKADLQEEARSRGLDDSGTKADLVDRINEHNEESMHKPEVLYPHEED